MIRRSIATCLLCSFCYSTSAQQLDAQRRAPHDVTPQSAIRHTPIEPESVNLTVPKGTALQVALDSEVRVRTIGQPIRGHTTAAVYAFDKLVIPAGMKVTGRISKIEDVSIRQRTFAALDANLSPRRDVQVGFTNVSLANGELLPIETNVVKGSGGVLQFVTTAGALKKQKAQKQKKCSSGKNRLPNKSGNKLTTQCGGSEATGPIPSTPKEPPWRNFRGIPNTSKPEQHTLLNSNSP